MLYFAYGSNLSIARLRERVPSAEKLGRFTLPCHDLRFHKHSRKDGSAKCDAFYTGDDRDVIWGVVFEMHARERRRLDWVEGLHFGYEKKTVTVFSEDGSEVEAFTYYATDIEPALRPYSWYLNHVLVGAEAAPLPAAYIERIRAVPAMEDADRERDRRERAIHR